MSQYTEGGYKTVPASGAIAVHLRCKITAGQLAIAGDGLTDDDVEIGTNTRPAFAAGEPITVSLRNRSGTTKMVAAEAITAGATVYGAAGGKVGATISGNPIGVAMEAAAADNDVIEVMRH